MEQILYVMLPYNLTAAKLTRIFKLSYALSSINVFSYSAPLILTYTYTCYSQHILAGNHHYSDPYCKTILSVNYPKMEFFSVYFCVWSLLLNILLVIFIHLLQWSVLHFFLLLSSSLLSGCINLLIQSPVNVHLGFFFPPQFGVISREAAMN